MELIPIIKLALTLFSILFILVTSVSYVLYKIKKRKSKSNPVIAAKELISPMNIGQPILAPAHANQVTYVRKKTASVQHLTRIKYQQPKERFKILNDSTLYREKKKVVEEMPRAFYQPQIEERTKFSLYDHYSDNGDKLKSLSFNTTI